MDMPYHNLAYTEPLAEYRPPNLSSASMSSRDANNNFLYVPIAFFHEIEIAF